MESRAMEIRSKANPKIRLNVIPGHFATNHSHINYYIDITKLKSCHKYAKLVAEELAKNYFGTQIDTIICMENTEVIAAFLADELCTRSNSVSAGNNINIIVPEYNSNNQMIFRDNIQNTVWGKNVLLMISSVTTGKTINRSLECIQYYNGNIAGIAAIFSAIDETPNAIPVCSIFGEKDVPDYHSYPYAQCPACKNKNKLDAIVNSYGYSKI